MDCRAIGDAGKNGDSVKSENRERLRRQSSKFYANNSLPHHGFVFKAFTKESLANIRDRKTSRCKNISASHWDPARLKPQPDPYLASGQQLPLALIRQLPAELVGKPIEDVDPYYADQEVSSLRFLGSVSSHSLSFPMSANCKGSSTQNR